MLTISKVFLSILFLLISGCATSSVEHITTSKEKQKMEEVKLSWQIVTVKYLDFEGGFYGLVSQCGDRLLPMGLPKEYKIEGTTLRVKGHLLTDMMTTQQWGEAFKVVEFELIKIGAGNKSKF